MGTWLRYGIGILVTVLVVLGAWQASIHLEGKKPQIMVSEKIRYLGPQSALSVSFTDEGRGLRQITAFIEQEGRRKLLGGMNLPAPGTMHRTLRLAFDQPGLDLKEGPARLIFSAVDYSFRKNDASMTMDVVVDHTPPPYIHHDVSPLHQPGRILPGCVSALGARGHNGSHGE